MGLLARLQIFSFYYVGPGTFGLQFMFQHFDIALISETNSNTTALLNYQNLSRLV
jgi:hypothetical protein